MCEEMGERKITKFIKIYEGDYFNKITFKEPITDIFLFFLLDSTFGSDVKSEKILLVAIFLHPVLAV